MSNNNTNSNNNTQERENYPVDAFAKYQKINDSDTKDFGKHGVSSYNKIVGMGQDDYNADDSRNQVPGAFDSSQKNYSTTEPVEKDLGHHIQDARANMFSDVGQENRQRSDMPGFTSEDFTNVPGTGAINKDTSESTNLNEGMGHFHIEQGQKDSSQATKEPGKMESTRFHMKRTYRPGKSTGFTTMNDDMMNDDMMNNELMKDDIEKDQMRSGEMNKGETMRNDDMRKNNMMRDDAMRNEMNIGNTMSGNMRPGEIRTEETKTFTMPAANMPVMMPMEMKDDNTMELKEGDKTLDPKAKKEQASRKGSQDDSESSKDPISAAFSHLGEKLTRHKSASKKDTTSTTGKKDTTSTSGKKDTATATGKRNTHKFLPSRRAAADEQPGGLSGEQFGTSGGRADRSTSIGTEEGAAGAYANEVGNMPSMVDPNVPTYGYTKSSTNTGAEEGYMKHSGDSEEHGNYMMHSAQGRAGRHVSVGSHNQDVEMNDAHNEPPIIHEAERGYHDERDSTPRGHADHENDHLETDESQRHKSGVFERIKHTLSKPEH